MLNVPHASMSHFFPQTHFVQNTEGQIIVDNIFHVDEIENYFRELFISSSIEYRGIERVNHSPEDTLVTQDEIEDAREILEEIYAGDIELLSNTGYSNA